jgi:hypothetical protein
MVQIDNMPTPTITIKLEENANRLVEIYKGAKGIKTKQEAINQIINEVEQTILKSVKG